MKYDFNQPIDRTLDHCAKYDEAAKKFGRSDVIPMWIADMDLRTAQPIMDAIAQSVQKHFGENAEIIGPVFAPVYKVHDIYRKILYMKH